MLLKKSVLDQPQNSREFFAPGPRRSLAMLQARSAQVIGNVAASEALLGGFSYDYYYPLI